MNSLSDVMAKSGRSEVPALVYADMPLGRKQTVEVANQLAQRFSQDAPIRALVGAILQECPDVPDQGPGRIAQWIRENVMYLQESPAVEVLQGPYTTLPGGLRIGNFEFAGTGVGDCDDLSILFATLCRAAGLEGYVAGIAWAKDKEAFFHAMGYCNGHFYELSRDEPYGGIASKQLKASRLPQGQVAYIYEPAFEKKGYWLSDGARSHISAHGTVLNGQSRRKPMNGAQRAMARQRGAMASAMRRRYSSMGAVSVQDAVGLLSSGQDVVGAVTRFTGDRAITQVANWSKEPVLVALGKRKGAVASISSKIVQAGSGDVGGGYAAAPGTQNFNYEQFDDYIDIAALIQYQDGTLVLEATRSRKGEQAQINVVPLAEVQRVYPLLASSGVRVRDAYPALQPSGENWKRWIGDEFNFLRLTGLLREAAEGVFTGATTGDWSMLQHFLMPSGGPSMATLSTVTTPEGGTGPAGPGAQTERKGMSPIIPAAAVLAGLWFMLGG